MTQTLDNEVSMTVENYLYGCVNFSIPTEAIKTILLKRKLTISSLVADIEDSLLELCEADLLRWIVTSPSRVGSVTDKDNDWEHSNGGYNLSKEDKSFLLNRANEIYRKYNEPIVNRKVIKITSFGSNSYHKPQR